MTIKADFYKTLRVEIAAQIFNDDVVINEEVITDSDLDSYFKYSPTYMQLFNENKFDELEDFIFSFEQPPKFFHNMHKHILYCMGRSHISGDVEFLHIHQSAECAARFKTIYLTAPTDEYCECCSSKQNLERKVIPFENARHLLERSVPPDIQFNVNFKTVFVAFDEVTLCKNCIDIIQTEIKTEYEYEVMFAECA